MIQDIEHKQLTTSIVTIRPMLMDDLAQVQEIDRLSFSLPWPANSYRFELLENPSSLLWVADARQADGMQVVIGMVVVWLIVDEAHIASIAVRPDYRGRGIGRRLMIVALRESIRRGARLSTLEVRASNVPARNLYRAFGYGVVNVRPRYYHDNNEDGLLMTVYGLDENYVRWLEKLDNQI